MDMTNQTNSVQDSGRTKLTEYEAYLIQLVKDRDVVIQNQARLLLELRKEKEKLYQELEWEKDVCADMHQQLVERQVDIEILEEDLRECLIKQMYKV